MKEPKEIFNILYMQQRGEVDGDKMDKDIASALSELKEWVLSFKQEKHNDFCGSRPEWYDLDKVGQCTCEMEIRNAVIEKISEGLK